MLSRVIGEADGREIQAAVFPEVGPEPQANQRERGTTERGPERRQERGLAPTEQAVVLCQHPEHSDDAIEAIRSAAFEEGKRQGERQARAELEPVMQRLTASLGEIVDLRPDLRRRAERDVINLALLIAKRVLHREISVDQEALTAIARVAFERLARAESWRVTIHPRFAEAIRSAIPDSQISRMKVEADPACSPGTLIVHSSEGTLDASVDVQLEEISRGLTDRLTKSGGLR
jgi:flagellar assembly protein FliH